MSVDFHTSDNTGAYSGDIFFEGKGGVPGLQFPQLDDETYTEFPFDYSSKFRLGQFDVDVPNGSISCERNKHGDSGFSLNGIISIKPEFTAGAATDNKILTVIDENNPNKKITITFNKSRQIIRICENWFEEIPDGCFYDMPNLVSFETFASKFGIRCLSLVPKLETFIGHNLKKYSSFFLVEANQLTSFVAPNLTDAYAILKLDSPVINEIVVPQEVVEAVIKYAHERYPITPWGDPSIKSGDSDNEMMWVAEIPKAEGTDDELKNKSPRELDMVLDYYTMDTNSAITSKHLRILRALIVAESEEQIKTSPTNQVDEKIIAKVRDLLGAGNWAIAQHPRNAKYRHKI